MTNLDEKIREALQAEDKDIFETGEPGMRGLEIHKKCFWDENLVVRNGMDTLQFSPFLNSNPGEMAKSFEAIRRVLDTVE